MQKNKIQKIKEIRTLVIRLGALGILGLGVFLIVQLFRGGGDSSDVPIDDTPLRVEQIRSILELNTIKFRDEVVVDTVEMYEDNWEAGFGPWEKLLDFNRMDEAFKASPIKRRLTLVVKGELLYGVDFKPKVFDITERKDTIVLSFPEPTLLSATVNPSNTDVFVEIGSWSDGARKKMMLKAKSKMIATGEKLYLPTKAKAHGLPPR